MMKAKRNIILATLGLSCIGMIAWFTSVSGNEDTDIGQTVETILARPVPTARVELKSNIKPRKFPGTVAATRSVDLAFSIDGLVEKLHGEEGRRVTKGELIAAIDQRDIKHSLDAAKASFTNLQLELKRTTSLLKKKVISQAEYDSVVKNYEIALADLEIRKKALEDTTLIAPFNGVIAKRYVESNEHIKKQAPIVAVKNIEELEVEIRVPENLMALQGVKPFEKIEVSFDVGKKRWYPAFVREYSVEANEVTRTYDVAIGFTPPTDVEVLPGMTATVRVDFVDGVDVAGQVGPEHISMVPVESVFSDGANSYVWVIPEKKGNPVRQKVIVGPMHDRFIEVQGDIREGIQVAVAGVHTLSEEMTVRPMKAGGEGLDG